MTHHRLRTTRTAFLSILTVLCLMGLSSAAYADDTLPPGCDPKVAKMQETRAQAQACLSIAKTEQTINQPDSVLAATCFNKSAGVASKKGGEIFSGSFVENLKKVIEPALKTWFGDGTGSNPGNFGNAQGKDSGSIDYDSTASTVEDEDSSECDALDKAWKNNQDTGINLKAPISTTDEDLRSDTPPKKCGENHDEECGQDFKDAWEACAKQGVFKAYKEAYEAVNPPTIPDFSSANSSCEVMNAAGMNAGSCE